MRPAPRLTTLAALAAAAAGTLGAPPARAQGADPADPRIRLDQLGFYTRGAKRGVVAAGGATRFAVVDAAGDTVLAAALGPARRWAPSGEVVRLADFAPLRRPGRYALVVPGVGRSLPFTVGDSVLRPVARAALKGFYYQRASAPLDRAHAGVWARPAGHPDDAVVVHPSAAGAGRAAGSRLASPGGWYDAGDYNKYVVNSAISTATLLALVETLPAHAAALATDIPESDDRLPDVLDEALWNLRWMRTMQDPADGGVYHKLTTAEFSGFVPPAADSATRYVVQKGTAATLDFAATAAAAARVVRRYPQPLPGLADSLVAEAMAAWRWARAHPDSVYDQARLNRLTRPAVNTGAYGDTALADEWQWAAAELAVTTGADSFLVAAPPPIAAVVPDWAHVGTLGLLALQGASPLPASLRAYHAVAAARVRALADTLVRRGRASAYGVAMEGGDFVWGSNAVAANQGVVLARAFQATADTAYLAAAVSLLDYLLGRNAVGISFVTGIGARSPRAPHHRPSAADGVAAPVPGLLVGGPNPGMQDRCAGYPSALPARAYLDDVCSYASNEIAINWNAPLAYLAAAVDAAYAERAR